MFRIPPTFCSQTLVFRYPGTETDARNREPVPGADWLAATNKNICEIFENDAVRRRLFLRFLRSGCFGIFLARGTEWIAYGWATQPGKGRPPHLPRSVAGWESYWIFHCHTKTQFRGQGIYKRLLARITALAREEGLGPIYIDTLPGNTPSVRAIISAGFKPCGVTHTFRLNLPHIASLPLSGFWAQDEPHPMKLDVPAPPLPHALQSSSTAVTADGDVIRR